MDCKFRSSRIVITAGDLEIVIRISLTYFLKLKMIFQSKIKMSMDSHVTWAMSWTLLQNFCPMLPLNQASAFRAKWLYWTDLVRLSENSFRIVFEIWCMVLNFSPEYLARTGPIIDQWTGNCPLIYAAESYFGTNLT